jgi:hypothetical protein
MNIVEKGIFWGIQVALVWFIAYFQFAIPFIPGDAESTHLLNSFLTTAAVYALAWVFARGFFTFGKHINV